MRNLRVLSDRQVTVPVDGGSAASQAPLSCALEGGKKHALLQPDGTLQCLAEDGRLLWDMPLSTGTATYVELVYVVELGALFVACLEGSIATVTVPAINSDGGLSEEPMEEVIGTFDGGLCAATWSADQSLLLIVTPQRRATVMTTSFQVFAEADIFPPAPQPQSSVRQAVLDAGPAAAVWSGLRIAATWRPDAQFFSLCVPGEAASGASGPGGAAAATATGAAKAAVKGDYEVRIFSQDGNLAGVGRHEDGSPVPGV
jgi:hypothetical protein